MEITVSISQLRNYRLSKGKPQTIKYQTISNMLGRNPYKINFLLPKNPDMWVFPEIVVPQNGWFIMENPIKMDDLGVPLFSETPMS